jgi:predicted amidohydrolase
MPTIARIATVAQDQRYFPSVEQNRQHVLGLCDLALAQKPDLVCLPETFSTAIIQKDVPELAEPVPGPTIDAAAERARRGRCYVICPLFTRRDGICRNSAVIIGRDGSIVGIYDKLKPVTSSNDFAILERGVTPGRGPEVFDLDFGRIGMQICFDIGFPEQWQRIQAQGARLVFWPSAYHGGFQLQAYAALHEYYVVTSVCSGRSRVIDPLGQMLAQTDPASNVLCMDLNLDFAVCHMDFNYAIPDRIAAAYGERVRVRQQPEGGLFLVEPAEAGLTVAALQREFGFESRQQYLKRHRDAYAQIAAGKTPQPQSAPHGTRPMWGKG